MPKYEFGCPNCLANFEFTFKVADFINFKKKNNLCQKCQVGTLIQNISGLRSKIERDKEYIVQEAKEEAHKIVKKLESGDERTCFDIYGDKINKLKFKNEK